MLNNSHKDLIKIILTVIKVDLIKIKLMILKISIVSILKIKKNNNINNIHKDKTKQKILIMIIKLGLKNSKILKSKYTTILH